MKLLAIVIILLSGNAVCKEKIYVGMLSYHYDREYSYNEEHPNIGYESEGGYFVEYFLNSKNKDTFLIGKMFRGIYTFNDEWDFGWDIGVSKGYNFKDREYSIIGLPTISWNKGKYGVDFRFGYVEVIGVRFTVNL